MEGAAKGSSEIAGENNMYKLGKYSMKYSIKQKTDKNNTKHKIICYNCENAVQDSVLKQVREKYPARSTKFYKCEKTGNFARQCKNIKIVRELKTENLKDYEQVNQEEIYNINMFRLNTLAKNNDTDNLIVEVIINNSLDKVIVDTGAKVSASGINHAKK